MKVRFGLKFLYDEDADHLALWRLSWTQYRDGQRRIHLFPCMLPCGALARVIEYYTHQINIERWEEAIKGKKDIQDRREEGLLEPHEDPDKDPLCLTTYEMSEHVFVTKKKKDISLEKEKQENVRLWIATFVRKYFPDLKPQWFLEHVLTLKAAKTLEIFYNSGYTLMKDDYPIAPKTEPVQNVSDIVLKEEPTSKQDNELLEECMAEFKAHTFDEALEAEWVEEAWANETFHQYVNYEVQKGCDVQLDLLRLRMHRGDFVHYQTYGMLEQDRVHLEDFGHRTNRTLCKIALKQLRRRFKRQGTSEVVIPGGISGDSLEPETHKIIGVDLFSEDNQPLLQWLCKNLDRCQEERFDSSNFNIEPHIRGFDLFDDMVVRHKREIFVVEAKARKRICLVMAEAKRKIARVKASLLLCHDCKGKLCSDCGKKQSECEKRDWRLLYDTDSSTDKDSSDSE